MYQNKHLRQSQPVTLQSTKHSPPFASKDQRFTYKVQRSPGPGSYQSSSHNYKLPQYHINRENQRSPIKKQLQWIWGSGRTSYINNFNYTGPSVGAYNLGLHEAVVGKNTSWGKSSRFNIENKLQTYSPGPGSYQKEQNQNKPGIGSVFKSKSPRTYIEKLISETSIQQLKKTQMQQLLNPQADENEAQKSVKSTKQLNVTKQKTKANTSVFASKIPRIVYEKSSNINVGPGTYELSQESVPGAKEKLPKIITVKGEQKRRKIKKSETQAPGPGFYDSKLKTIEKSLESSGKVVIFNEQRFQDKKQLNPGPGHYMLNKNALQIQLQKLHKFNPEKPSFNSTSIRPAPQLPSKSNPLCTYNLDYYDLQNRLKKSQQHIQKLKIMEVTVPAFNSKAKR